MEKLISLHSRMRAVVGAVRGVGRALDRVGQTIEVAPFVEGRKL